MLGENDMTVNRCFVVIQVTVFRCRSRVCLSRSSGSPVILRFVHFVSVSTSNVAVAEACSAVEVAAEALGGEKKTHKTEPNRCCTSGHGDM